MPKLQLKLHLRKRTDFPSQTPWVGLAHQEAPPVPANLVDVFHAVDRELGQAWNIKLPAAIWAQSDLQLLLGLLSKQVSERGTGKVPLSCRMPSSREKEKGCQMATMQRWEQLPIVKVQKEREESASVLKRAAPGPIQRFGEAAILLENPELRLSL